MDKSNQVATEQNAKKEDHDCNEDQEMPGAIDPKILDELPPEARKKIEVAMLSMQTHRFGPMPNPLSEKINEHHIDKILEIAEKDDERTFNDIQSSRKFTLTYILIASALFVFATVYLIGIDKEALYKELIKLIAVFLGGLGSGFGIRSYMSK